MKQSNKYNIYKFGLIPVAAVLLASCASNYNLRQSEVNVPSVYRGSADRSKVVTVTGSDEERELSVNDKHVERVEKNYASNRVMNERLSLVFDMAYNGTEMTYMPDGQYSTTAPKGSDVEIVVYRTQYRGLAMSWSKRMSKQGYAITVSYNKKDMLYTCTAKRVKE